MATVHERVSVLEPPRFTLRTLLLAVSACCCLFAVMASIGRFESLMLLMFLALVAAHVLGNSLGTRLRDKADRLAEPQHGVPVGRARGSSRFEVAGPKGLTQNRSQSRLTLGVAALSAVAGAGVGSSLLSGLYPHADAGAVTLGLISSGVLGAFAGFAVSSFASVASTALREAQRNSNPVVRSQQMPGPR